jgi:quercetin dioxygenase-like cupin family protein
LFTRRDLTIAAVAALVTAGAFLAAQQKPAIHTTIVDWNSVPVKQTDVGSVRSFLNVRTPTLENLEIHVTTLNPGKSPHAPHRHGHEEILIVKEGNIEALVDGQWKPAGPGSVIFLASNELHSVRNAGTTPATYHVLALTTQATPPDAK